MISPGPFSSQDVQAIRELGTVTRLIAPNKMHHLFLTEAASHFPEAKVLIAPGLAEKRPDLTDFDVLPQSLENWGLEQKLIRGLPELNETVFFHQPSGTLVLTDLAFHFPTHPHLPTRLMLAVNGALGRFGPTRLLKHVFLKDREAFAEDLEDVLRWPIQKIVVGHGREILEGGLEKMRLAFSAV